MKTLLHACCGPCSLEPHRILAEAGHDVSIAYINPNIQPREEFERRWETLASWAAQSGIPASCAPYEADAWRKTAGAVWAAGGSREERCRACYRMRLTRAARQAAEGGFEALSTTLAVSPYQLSEVCREELERAAAAFGLRPLWQDFRPWYAQATIRSRKLGMYRQNYCGCLVSRAEAAAEREQRAAERASRAAVREAELAERRAAKAARQQEFDRRQQAKRQALRAWRQAQREKESGTEGNA